MGRGVSQVKEKKKGREGKERKVKYLERCAGQCELGLVRDWTGLDWTGLDQAAYFHPATLPTHLATRHQLVNKS